MPVCISKFRRRRLTVCPMQPLLIICKMSRNEFNNFVNNSRRLHCKCFGCCLIFRMVKKWVKNEVCGVRPIKHPENISQCDHSLTVYTIHTHTHPTFVTQDHTVNALDNCIWLEFQSLLVTFISLISNNNGTCLRA